MAARAAPSAAFWPQITSQNRNFSANCSCREVVAVAVIIPAVGESAAAADGFDGVGPLLKTTGFGVVKLV